MQGCREAILEDIEVLPRKGSPGSVEILTEKNVEPIVTSDEGHIVAAATTLGQGRIFVITHGQYFVSFKEGEKHNEALKKLHDNVRKWVSKGSCRGTAGIRNIKNMKEVQGKVLLWCGGPIEDGMEEKVKQFVENGGGLVHAMCPWGWKQRNKEKSLKEMPLYGLIQSVGIEFTTKVVRCNRNGFTLSVSCDNEMPNCGGEDETKDSDNEEHGEDSQAEGNDEEQLCNEVLAPEGEAPPSWGDYDVTVKQWRSEILRGVDSVPKYGAPGTCVPFGKKAVSIVSGSMPQNVIMAGGSLGEGRVFCFTHGAYIQKREEKPLKKLMTSIFDWVSRGQYKNPRDILQLDPKTESFEGKKILLWTGAMLENDLSDKVMKFVKEGGALIHATAPWGWLKLNTNKKLKDIPLTEILIEAGLFYTKELSRNDGNFKVDLSDEACHNNAAENIGYSLARAVNKEDLAKYGEYLSMGLGPAPAAVKALLADDMQKVYDCHKKTARYPSLKKPLTDPSQRCLTLLCDTLCNMGHDGMNCIPCADDYPGPCPDAPTVCAERSVTTTHKTFHSTGLYAKPGAKLQVEVVSPGGTLNHRWVLRIGSHTDKIFKKDAWKRWPNLVKRRALDASSFELFSPYGGLIYLESPGFKVPRTMSVRITGAMEAPQYNITDPDCRKNWLIHREDPGPWVDLCGRYISFTMPKSSVEHLDDPGLVLALWDRVVESHCSLRGTDPADHQHQWVVCDAQPVLGYMHAGYPIVTMMDVADPDNSHKFLLDHDSVLSEGRWGMFHELGHNMQRKWWSFKGTGEVTCNIFTLHAMDVICNQKPWIHPWLAKFMTKMKRTLEKDDPYEDWSKFPGVALGVYAQLQHSFGWDAYTTVFRHYEDLDWRKRPHREAEQIAYWIEVFSNTVGYNLCPMFEYWGFKLPDALKERLSGRPFLPDDEMTQLAPHRVQVLEAAYPDLVRHPSNQACCDDQQAQKSCQQMKE